MNLFKRFSFWTLTLSLIFLGMLFNYVSTLYPGPIVYPNHVHTTLYVDRNFDDEEFTSIVEAALEWSTTTNHIVEYDVVQLPLHNKQKVQLTNSIIFIKASPDTPEVIVLDSSQGNKTLGFFNENAALPCISLVTDRLSLETYKAVVLHELGHSLGLRHLEGLENIDTLMFPYTSILINKTVIPTGSEHITLRDGRQFCKLYHCDPNTLKYQEEPFHF